MFLSLIASLALAGTDPPPGEYALPASGFTLLTPGWHMSRWSDWDFKGNSLDKSIFVTAWSTTYQLSMDDATAERLAAAWKVRVEKEEHATDLSVSGVRLEDVAGQKRIRATVNFTSGATKAVYHASAFTTAGLTAQVAVMATAPNSARALAALETLLSQVVITAPPVATGAAEDLSTPRGKVPLPGGWRNPVEAEMASVAALYAKTGAKDSALCTPAIHAMVDGNADILLSCAELSVAGILDEASFGDEATLFAQRTFGKSAKNLPLAEMVTRRDGVGLLLHANQGLWVGSIQTEGGTQVFWVAGDEASDAELGNAARATIANFALSEAAKPNPPFGALMAHRLAYHKSHPTVWIPAALALAFLAFIVRMILRGSPETDPHGNLPT